MLNILSTVVFKKQEGESFKKKGIAITGHTCQD